MKKYAYFTEFIIVGIVGTLWHFLYDWTNKNAFIGAIAPVNESTWEHLKLLFFPAVIYSVIEYFILKDRPKNYIAASALGIFGGMLAITAFFYTYTGILGYNLMVLDVLSFFIGVFVMLYIKNRIIKNKKLIGSAAQYVSLGITALSLLLFVLWSFNPPSIGIFTPPVNA